MWEPMREPSSNATHYGEGTLVHSRLSSRSHCGLILGLKERNCFAKADLHLYKNSKENKKHPDWEYFTQPAPIPRKR